MELEMRVIYALPLLVPTLLGLAACGNSPPPATQVIVQSPPATQVPATQVIVQAPPTTVVPSAPMPPPPPISELVPPPPPSATPTVWQPGHWQYTGVSGNPWNWQHGQYVAVPPGATAWVPGQWQDQDGGWVWRSGHWAA
jgi:hypothetical protein